MSQHDAVLAHIPETQSLAQTPNADALVAAILDGDDDGSLLALFSQYVRETFTAWSNTLPSYGHGLSSTRPLYPAPDAIGGLPAGYEVSTRLQGFQKDTDLFLVRRAGGGAVLVRHEYDLERSMVFLSAASLCDLYETMKDAINGTDRVREHPEAALVAGWLKDVLMTMYDHTDPVEMAEQMVFALGGRVGTPPRAAF
jgi:hypothetical protein